MKRVRERKREKRENRENSERSDYLLKICICKVKGVLFIGMLVNYSVNFDHIIKFSQGLAGRGTSILTLTLIYISSSIEGQGDWSLHNFHTFIFSSSFLISCLFPFQVLSFLL